MEVRNTNLKFSDIEYLKMFGNVVFDDLGFPKNDFPILENFEEFKCSYFQNMLKFYVEDDYILYLNKINDVLYFIIIDIKNNIIVNKNYAIYEFFENYFKNNLDDEIFFEGTHLIGEFDTNYLINLINNKQYDKLKNRLIEKYKDFENQFDVKIGKFEDLYISYKSYEELYYKIIKNMYDRFLHTLVYNINKKYTIDEIMKYSCFDKEFCFNREIKVL